jgi:hypothetical protein
LLPYHLLRTYEYIDKKIGFLCIVTALLCCLLVGKVRKQAAELVVHGTKGKSQRIDRQPGRRFTRQALHLRSKHTMDWMSVRSGLPPAR